MKRVFLIFVLTLAFLGARAYDFEINGVCYDIIGENSDELQVVQGAGYSGIIILPETVNYRGVTYTVSSIGDNAFFYCTGLEYVEISSTVTSIGNNAFYGCTALEEIDIPDNVADIGSSAFNNCSGATSLRLGSSLTTIPEFAFSYCSSLEKVVVPDSVKVINEAAFLGCSGMKNLSIGKNVAAIANNSFVACNALDTIDCYPLDPPLATELIFDREVYYGAVLRVPYYSDGVYQRIAPWDNFRNIEETLNPPVSEFMTDGIFYHVTDENMSVEVSSSPEGYSGDLAIPAVVKFDDREYEVTGISAEAFKENTSLRSISLPSSITSIGSRAFSGCHSLNGIELPSGLTELPYGCFMNCLSLPAIELPENMTSVGENCFFGCFNISSVVIGKNIQSFGEGAFSGCVGIKKITSYAMTPPVTGEKIFEDKVFKDAKLEVGYQALASYRTNEPWSLFSDISAYDYISIKTISFFEEEYVMKVGSVLQINYTISPRNYTSIDLGWQTTDPEIADVNEIGRVQAYTPGVVFIAAYSESDPGVYAECMVSVEEDGDNAVEIIESSNMSVSVRNGEIRLVNKPERLKVRVLDISGRLVKETDSDLISGLNSGIYILQAGSYVGKVVL